MQMQASGVDRMTREQRALAEGRPLPPATCIEDDLARGECLLTMGQAAKLRFIPRFRGKAPTRMAVWKWSQSKHYAKPLEMTVRPSDGRSFTTEGAMKRFFGIQ